MSQQFSIRRYLWIVTIYDTVLIHESVIQYLIILRSLLQYDNNTILITVSVVYYLIIPQNLCQHNMILIHESTIQCLMIPLNLLPYMIWFWFRSQRFSIWRYYWLWYDDTVSVSDSLLKKKKWYCTMSDIHENAEEMCEQFSVASTEHFARFNLRALNEMSLYQCVIVYCTQVYPCW